MVHLPTSEQLATEHETSVTQQLNGLFCWECGYVDCFDSGSNLTESQATSEAEFHEIATLH